MATWQVAKALFVQARSGFSSQSSTSVFAAAWITISGCTSATTAAIWSWFATSTWGRSTPRISCASPASLKISWPNWPLPPVTKIFMPSSAFRRTTSAAHRALSLKAARAGRYEIAQVHRVSSFRRPPIGPKSRTKTGGPGRYSGRRDSFHCPLGGFCWLQRAMNYGHGGMALPKGAQPQQNGRLEHDRKRDHGLIQGCPHRKAAEHQNQHEPRRRAPGPCAEPDKLFAPAVLFDGHAQASGAEQPAAHFQIPAVVVAPARYHHTLRPKGGFKRSQPLFSGLPLLAPHDELSRPRQHGISRTRLPPRRQTPAHPAAQPRQRLK